MFIEEHLYFIFINVPHLLWRNGYFISIFISTISGKAVHVINIRKVVVKHAKFAKCIDADGPSGIMRQPLIALGDKIRM
jgi:hypothetical protein